MSFENENAEHNVEHVDNALEEARIKVFGEEVIKMAENITFHAGEVQRQDVIDEAENLTYLAGVTEPAETVRAAELITAFETEVAAVGENLPEEEDPDKDQSIDSEAARMFDENKAETAEDERVRKQYLAEKAAIEARAEEMESQIDKGTDENI